MSRENNTQETSGITGKDDPTERRRILNIQAQRRYRQRKRSRLRELESLAQLSVQQQSVTPSRIEPDQSSTSRSNYPFSNFYPVLGLSRVSDHLNSNSQPNPLAETGIEELELLEDSGHLGDENPFFLSDSRQPAHGIPSSIDFESFSGELDNQNSELISSTHSNAPPLDLGLSSIYAAGQEIRPNTTFSDYLVTVPGLSCIRAHVEIFKVMHGPDFKLEIWNPQALSPFTIRDHRYVDHAASKPSHYPPEFHPTALQRTVQHHPVLDVLPWPSFRDKFLYVMTLSEEFRPTNMRGDMASVTMQMMATIKDAGGGLRIRGDNPFDIEAWEVGQLFYTNFWWAIDHDIVVNSNKLRLERGENVLRAKF